MPLFNAGLPARPGSRLVGALAAALVLAACAHRSANVPTLYERLGGEQNVAQFVDRLVDRTTTDPRTARSFDGIRPKALKESIAQQICALAGGGCVYEGETMARVHADHHIRASEFDALVAMLREELDRAGVDDGAKNDLLKLLAPMKRDIVQPPKSLAQSS